MGAGSIAQRSRVAAVRDLGHGYAILVLDVGQAIDARPGQFVMMRGDWGHCPLLPRPMSLLRPGQRPEVLIKVVGEGTRRLCASGPGAVVDLLGPLGRPFDDPPDESRLVLVAGGVGVAPLWFLAEDLRRRGKDRPLFLYGGRTAHDLPGSEQIAASCSLTLTTEDGSRGSSGRVTAALAPVLSTHRPQSPVVVYTCGPTAMMAAVARMAREVDARCVACLEAPMACGYGVCLGCAVARTGGGYHYVCVDGPVIDAASVAWEGSGRG